ncbi:hypothetical protein [Paenibacillus eucommiae]|uniref:GGDEF domain-containing protein n=1 Tax=Paenibacillus eucommiae TaxID=1355755 RepID=A0ABS4J7U7_9BACL|nr:hypothetical protein [Paenibacillus eucommiae]MBP1994829.1 hypothetical protein [Paenibacillus eucommiae]
MSDSTTTSLQHGIAIGIIGPDALVDKILDTIRAFPSFSPVARTFQTEAEVLDIAADLIGKVEVLLFSDPISYQLVKDKLHFPIPVHYVPLTGTGLYRALFCIGKQSGLRTLSIDTLSKRAVHSALQELGELHTEAIFFEDTRHPSQAELIAFHKQQFQSSRSSAALTALRSVSEALTEDGIPNEWIAPTEQDIVVSLERALLSSDTRRSKESQIVVGFIHVDDFNRLAIKKTSEHEVQRLKLDIHRMMLGYVESLEGHLTHMGSEEYSFITTRGIFERETGGYKSLPLARVADKRYELSLSVGIGFGRSANEAGTHARLALSRSKDAGGNMCFIVREDRSIIGPLEMTQPLEYDLSLIDISLLKEADEVGLTSAYLSKLIARVTRSGVTDYNAHELAATLGVTVRSTHRLLLAWLDAGFVEIISEERGAARGRPKQIYRLSFLKELFR